MRLPRSDGEETRPVRSYTRWQRLGVCVPHPVKRPAMHIASACLKGCDKITRVS